MPTGAAKPQEAAGSGDEGYYTACTTASCRCATPVGRRRPTGGVRGLRDPARGRSGHDLDDVFVLADMTIEVEDLPSGLLVKFNGTTEWALDSVPADDVLWIPWEHQLRALLGEAS